MVKTPYNLGKQREKLNFHKILGTYFTNALCKTYCSELLMLLYKLRSQKRKTRSASVPFISVASGTHDFEIDF